MRSESKDMKQILSFENEVNWCGDDRHYNNNQ